MSMTITDAEDAMLYAQADVSEWADEFMAQWYAPIGTTMLAILVNRMPADALERIQQSNPVGQDALAAIINTGGRYARAR